MAHLGATVLDGLCPYTDDPATFEAALQAARQADDDKGPIYKELWHACAGPHVNIPSVGEKVFYCPQGHLEQVEANTNQQLSSELSTYNLPYKIPCIVIHVNLKVDDETDEVVAQVTLLPETKEARNHLLPRSIIPSRPQGTNTRFFSKVLTKSDTSTRSGFSVLTKQAKDFFPPLDMTLEKPAQDLVAKDLNDRVWHFRHTYRGSPKRHIMSSGWNTFLGAKKIEQGDAVIFVRNENGEFYVGLRRSKKSRRTSSSTILTSRNIQLGLLATVHHAVLTGSMFSVYDRPRSSPAEFIIPYAQYTMSLKRNISVGTMFTIKSDNDEFPDESFTGTIVRIEEVDPVRWPGSLWRCLQIKWHGLSEIVHPERISPWKVVPLAITDKRLYLSPGLIKRHHQAEHSAIASVNPGLSLQDFITNVSSPKNHFEILPNEGTENISTREYGNEEELSFSHWICPSNSDSDSAQSKRKKPKISFPHVQNQNCLKSCRLFGVNVDTTSENSISSWISPNSSQEGSSSSVNHFEDCSISAGSCIKVHKYGNVITQVVDLARLNGYEELFCKLDQMFDFEGTLMKRRDWCVMYKDDEGGNLFVGDASWTVFCSMAQKLLICPKEEVEKL